MRCLGWSQFLLPLLLLTRSIYLNVMLPDLFQRDESSIQQSSTVTTITLPSISTARRSGAFGWGEIILYKSCGTSVWRETIEWTSNIILYGDVSSSNYVFRFFVPRVSSPAMMLNWLIKAEEKTSSASKCLGDLDPRLALPTHRRGRNLTMF